jgi:hypothetical protein
MVSNSLHSISLTYLIPKVLVTPHLYFITVYQTFSKPHLFLQQYPRKQMPLLEVQMIARGKFSLPSSVWLRISRRYCLETEHLELIHCIEEIRELSGFIDQIATGHDLLVNQVPCSLALVPNEVQFDFYYKSHPMTEIFGKLGLDYVQKIIRRINSIPKAVNLGFFMLSSDMTMA